MEQCEQLSELSWTFRRCLQMESDQLAIAAVVQLAIEGDLCERPASSCGQVVMASDSVRDDQCMIASLSQLPHNEELNPSVGFERSTDVADVTEAKVQPMVVGTNNTPVGPYPGIPCKAGAVSDAVFVSPPSVHHYHCPPLQPGAVTSCCIYSSPPPCAGASIVHPMQGPNSASPSPVSHHFHDFSRAPPPPHCSSSAADPGSHRRPAPLSHSPYPAAPGDFVVGPVYSVGPQPSLGQPAPHCPIHGDVQQRSGVLFSDPYAPRSAPVAGVASGQYYLGPGVGGPHYQGIPYYVQLPVQHQQQGPSPHPAFRPFYSAVPMYSADYYGHGSAPMRPCDAHWQMDPTMAGIGGVVHLPDCQFAVVQPGHEVDGVLLRSSSEPAHAVGFNERPGSDTGLPLEQKGTCLSGRDGLHVTDEQCCRPMIENENTEANVEQAIIPNTPFSAADNSGERPLKVDPQTFPAAESILITTDGREIDLTSSSDLSFLGDLTVTKELPRSHTPPERDTSSRDLVVIESSSLDTKDSRSLVATPPVSASPTVLEQSCETASPAQSAAAASGPSSLAFTIDFGQSDGKPQITDRWTHPTPFRIHAGIQSRSASSKCKNTVKERNSDANDKMRKTIKNLSQSRGTARCAREDASGYHSDGHVSGASSDNESASVCSEMVGSTGAKRLAENLLHKSLLNSTPSKSQPSLAAPSRRIPVPKSAPKKSVLANATPPRVQPASTIVGSTRASATRQPSAPSSESRHTMRKTTSSRKSDVASVIESSKKGISPAKKTGEKPSKSSTKLSAVGARDCVNSDGVDTLDVTSYLINRMLGRMQAPLPEVGSVKEKKQRVPAPQNKKQLDGDNLSDAGTYTIDDDEEDEGGKSEVRMARDRIGDVFGITESSDRTHDNLIRPVIHEGQVDRNITATETAEDDVFDTNDDDEQAQTKYKKKLGEAVSTAITAANQAIQQVLGLESRRKGQSHASNNSPLELASARSSSTHPGSDNTIEKSSSPVAAGVDALDDDLNQRQCATVVCESGGDFGTFTISYDAPSPRQRLSTRSVSRESASPSSVDPPLQTKVEDSGSTIKSKTPGRVLSLPHDRDASRSSQDTPTNTRTEVESSEKGEGRRRVQPAIPRPVARGSKVPSGLAVARSVGDVSRLLSGESVYRLQRGIAQNQTGRRTPPALQSGWTYWNKEKVDMSDAVSEADSSCSYGADRSGGERRRGGLKSAPVAPVARPNRTFALRCAAKQRTESEASTAPSASVVSGKASRSRSAENNARLALATRSRSGSRVRTSKPDDAGSSWRKRQPSNESTSTSVSSNLSLATHDGATFTRRDGGRFSMRVEKSSTTGNLLSLTKQASPLEKVPSGPRAKQTSAATSSSESKELTAWKKRKDYDARKSVADARTRSSGQSLSQPPSDNSRDISAVDEIAMLSNAVAYNLNVLSQSTQNEAVTLDLSRHRLLSTDIAKSAFTAVMSPSSCKLFPGQVPTQQSNFDEGDDLSKNSCDAVLVNSIQQMSSKVKSLTDKLMAKVREEGQKASSDSSSHVGVPESWQNTSPELAAILENLKRTEQHLQIVHSSLHANERTGAARRHASASRVQRHQQQQQQQQQVVAHQRRQHAELAGFKPIDKPTINNSKSSVPSAVVPRLRQHSTGGDGVLTRRSSESSSNPLSGDEYY